MSKELQDKIGWLEDKIKSLEGHLRDLEFENYQLKSSIGNAIRSLEKQNEVTKEMIWGISNGRITDNENFVPLVKKGKSKK